jgi:hypothetical protein
MYGCDHVALEAQRRFVGQPHTGYDVSLDTKKQNPGSQLTPEADPVGWY